MAALPPITVRELIGLVRRDDGSAMVEVLLSETPDRAWAHEFERRADDPPAGLLGAVHLERRLQAVRFVIEPPVDKPRQRSALEWLHDVVAATNDAFDA